ncbi:MAG: hypothetical protein U0821_25325 [Chloroflexota bacterium]
MSIVSVLRRVWHAIRGHPLPPDEDLVAYAAVVTPALDRAEALYAEWFRQAAAFEEPVRMANSAAIHRWEAATLGHTLDVLPVPPILVPAHNVAVEGLALASKAAQLLSSGTRFHNTSAICDGQLMLEDSRVLRLEAVMGMKRVFDRGRRRAERQKRIAEYRAAEQAARLEALAQAVAEPPSTELVAAEAVTVRQ